MELYFSFVVPVYNRPHELQELLESLAAQTYDRPFEVVVVEDGSTLDARQVVDTFQERLQIQYLDKPNTGPGDSRNVGMRMAKGNYCIVLDSDCIIPPKYLETVAQYLEEEYVACFGGPDAAHPSFTAVQKAINYAMTSVWSTGGIRGRKKGVGKFQPRSFNMGISKKMFEATGGFGNIHPGEDPDLAIRAWGMGFESRLFPKAFVYHKRRIDWNKFYTQVKKFGMVRPILNRWHPQTAKVTYWFPTCFCLGLLLGLILGFGLGYWHLLMVYGLYFLIVFVDALSRERRIGIAILAVWAVCVQFLGYGWGFLKSNILLTFVKKAPEALFPKLFFKTN